jgi:hypothetical protein
VKALASFAASLFGGVCVAAAVSFFLLGLGEPKWGPMTNMVITAAIFLPATAVAALGYAASAYLRDRGHVRPPELIVCPAVFGAAGGVAGFSALMADLLPSAWVTAGCFLALGVLAPWPCNLARKGAPNAA